MTREEAIFYIKELQKTYASMDKKVAEAVDMAIEALSQPIVAKHFDIQSGYIYCSPQIAENVKIVVRCKDCRFAMVRTKEEMDKPIRPQPILCEWLCIGVENDAYCSHGERREKNDYIPQD